MNRSQGDFPEEVRGDGMAESQSGRHRPPEREDRGTAPGTDSGLEDNLRAIFSAIRDGILVADSETRKFVYANPGMCRMLGYRETELLGLRAEDIHPRELSGYVAGKFQDLIAGKSEVVEAIPTLRQDGTLFLCDISASTARFFGRDCLVGVFRDVTPQREAEAALREREARLRRAEKLARLGHYAFDAGGGNLIVSETVKEEIWGFDPGSNPQFEDYVAHIHPEDVGPALAAVEEATRQRRGFDVTYRIVRPDGSQRVVHSLGELLADEPDAPPRFFGTMADITHLKSAEDVLRQSEERLRLVIDTTRDGIWDWNVLTQEAYMSPRWKEIAGYGGDELPGAASTFFGLLHAADRPAVEEAIRRHFEENEPFAMEFRLRHKDGTDRWVLGRGTAVRDTAGHPARMLGSITDITEQRQAEEARRAGEARYRRLHQSMTDAFVEVDMTGRIVDSNPAYRDMLGYTEGELRQLTYVDITPERWHDLEAQLVAQQILPDGSSGVYEKEYRRKDGAIIPVELRTFLLRDEDGAPSGMWAIVRDITARKRAAEELLIKESALDAALACIAIAGLDQKLTYVNRAWLRLHGYETAEQVLGTSPLTRVARPGEAAAIIDALRLRGVWSGEIECRRRDGSVFLAEMAASTATSVGGKPLCLMASFQDISERKQVQEATVAERDRLRQILDSQFGFVAVLGLDGAIEEVNRTPLDLMGLDRADLLGQKFWEAGWLEPETVPIARAAISRAAEGESVRLDINAQFPNAGSRVVDAVFSPLRSPRGEGIGVVGFGVDITDRKWPAARVPAPAKESLPLHGAYRQTTSWGYA